MGLDNGFIVKSNKRKIERENLPNGINYPFENDYGIEPEIVYWRKNWGLRNAVLDYISDRDSESGYYQIDTPEQIFGIVNILFTFMDEYIWEDSGNSIWSYEEIKPILQQNIINLILMIPFMKENPDVYLIFYDSY